LKYVADATVRSVLQDNCLMQVVIISDEVAAIAATVHDLSQEMDLVSLVMPDKI
jgi:hypothetical protein